MIEYRLSPLTGRSVYGIQDYSHSCLLALFKPLHSAV